MREYFATKIGDELGQCLKDKVEEYYKYLRDSGLLAELKESYRLYYGDSVIRGYGSHGELKKIRVNHYANLVKHLLVMVTANRPAWEPRSANTDHKSQSQTVLAAGLLDFYMREKRLERMLKKAAEFALFLREGWIVSTWNTKLGEAIAFDDEDEQEIKEGDIEYKVFNILDMIRDVSRRSINDLPWLISREQINRFELAEQYQEQEEKILAVDSSREFFEEIFYRVEQDQNDQDNIDIYTFFHSKTLLMPEGRMVEFLKDGTILFDGPLPYRKLPCHRITAGELDQTPFGHSQALDLIPIQKALDQEYSTVVTNHNAFGVQNIAVPKGSGVTVTQVTGGLNLIEYDAKLGVPQPLNLVQTPAEIFKAIEMMSQTAETISGVNSIARGNAPASLSGAAMALIQSTSLQFASGLQASYTALLEDVGTATIQLLQDFAQTPRIAALVGRHNRPLLKEFKSDDLALISRVTVDSASSLSKTTAGKVEIANQLLQAGMIKRPEQYLMVLQTGQLEPMLESDTSQLLRIRSENERLSDGEPVQAMISDDHTLDIKEHLTILDSPDARENPEIVQVVLAHVEEHIALAKSMPPELAQILGREPIGQPMQAPQGLPEDLNATDPILQQADGVNLPNLPKVAGTNETFDPMNPQLPVGG